MHKLSLYLSPSQLEKIKTLTGESDMEKIEEFINNTVYEGIDFAWLNHKAKNLHIDEETVRLTADGLGYEVWSDGDMAVISFADEDYIIQKIDGKMHYVLQNGSLVECNDKMQEVFERVLAAAGREIKDYSVEELNEPKLYK